MDLNLKQKLLLAQLLEQRNLDSLPLGSVFVFLIIIIKLYISVYIDMEAVTEFSADNRIRLLLFFLLYNGPCFSQ